MATGTHRYGLVVDGFPVGLGSVAHGSRCEVYGTGHHANVGEGDVVERHVVLQFCPANLLHTEHTFVVENIGVGAVETYGSIDTVEVEDEVVACCALGQAFHHFEGCLVITVEEVHLETLDAHVGIVLAGSLQLLVNNVEYRP